MVPGLPSSVIPLLSVNHVMVTISGVERMGGRISRVWVGEYQGLHAGCLKGWAVLSVDRK